MRKFRILFFLAPTLVALIVGLRVLGGIGIVQETELVGEPEALKGLPTVHIQNTANSQWGSLEVLGVSSFGPPYELFISGTLPLDTPVTRVQLQGVRIDVDGVLVKSLGREEVTLSDISVNRLESKTLAKGFTFSTNAATDIALKTIRVSGELVLDSATGNKRIAFNHLFTRRARTNLHIGSRRWYL